MITRFPLNNALLCCLLMTLISIPNSGLAVGQMQCTGQWEGCIEFTSAQPKIILNIDTDEDGSLCGKVNLPNQNEKDMPVTNLTVEDNVICFDLVNGKACARFEGTFTAETQTIQGDFIQAGHKYPFELKMKDDKLTKADK